MARFRFAVAAGLSLVSCAMAAAQIGPKVEPIRQDASLFQFTVTTPLPLLYLEQATVRDELRLDEAQARKVEALQKSWADATKIIDLERGSLMADSTDLMRRTRKQLDELLTVAQMKRLDQIILRHREKEHGMSAVLCTIAGDLKLSGAQQDRFELLRRKRAEIVLEQLTSGERANAIRRAVHEANSEFTTAVTELLTKDQQARLREMLGEPIAAELRLGEPTAVAVDSSEKKSVYLGALFGKYALEAEILNNESVHKELKLDRDQIRLAKEFNVEWWARHEKRLKEGMDAVESIEAAHGFVAAQLGEILTGKQRKRLDQIAVQYRIKVAGEVAGFGHPTTGWPPYLREDGFPIKGTKSRAEVMSRLQMGETIEMAMPAAQLGRFRQGLGEPFKETLVINSPLKTRQGGRVLKPTLVAPHQDNTRNNIAKFMLDNGRRYRLDEEQIARLKAIDDDLPTIRRLLHRELSQLPPSTDAGAARNMMPEAKAVEQFRKAVYEQCLDVLDKQQQSLWGAEIRRAKASIIDY